MKLEMMRSVVLVLVGLVGVGKAVPIANGVEGDPEIECGPNSLTINFNTQNDFEGSVYVKGLFNEGQCKSTDRNRRVAGIELPFDSCNTRRLRSLNPKGVFVSTVVIVTFHPFFITKIDRAYRIQCFYMEADKTVDTNIQVSMLTTEFQTQQVPMPICRYELLDGATGPPIEFAIVGQPVYHNMIVRDCFVDDTNGDTVELVNGAGCAVDLYLLNNPEYPTDLMAGVEAHVFKYADRANLYFQCQITILVREPNEECPRPVCPIPSGRGAGAASPREEPPRNIGQHPFPLQPGSPYLPGGVDPRGVDPRGRPPPFDNRAPPPPLDRRGGGFRGGFVDPRGKRDAGFYAQELGTIDVAAQMESVDITDNQTRKPVGLRELVSEERGPGGWGSGDVCVSPGTFHTVLVLIGALALLALAAAVYLRLRK